LAISSKKSLWRLKKNERRGPNSSGSSPRSTAACAVRDAVGQRERQLLRRRRARLPDVVARDRNCVPARRLARAELDHVGDDAQRRLGRTDPFFLGDELLQHVVLNGAAEVFELAALALADDEVHREARSRPCS
jgi:hypothetical protein